MKLRNYIPADGYTLPGFVDAKPGFNEAVRFTYRPVTSEQQALYSAALSHVSDTPTNPLHYRKCVDIVYAHLVSWDIKSDDDTGEMPISIAAIRRLSPEVFFRLYGIIYGMSATDIDPLWDDEQQADEIVTTISALEHQEAPGTVRSRLAEKNLDEG
jgi:hypothetical protein